jgi:hypothetical protein
MGVHRAIKSVFRMTLHWRVQRRGVGGLYTIVSREGMTAVTLRERGKERLTMGGRLSILTAVCIGG